MDMFLKMGQGLWKLIKVVAFVTNEAIKTSENTRNSTKQYTHREAYELLHEDKILISEFVENISD